MLSRISLEFGCPTFAEKTSRRRRASKRADTHLKPLSGSHHDNCARSSFDLSLSLSPSHSLSSSLFLKFSGCKHERCFNSVIEYLNTGGLVLQNLSQGFNVCGAFTKLLLDLDQLINRILNVYKCAT